MKEGNLTIVAPVTLSVTEIRKYPIIFLMLTKRSSLLHSFKLICIDFDNPMSGGFGAEIIDSFFILHVEKKNGALTNLILLHSEKVFLERCLRL